MTALTEEQRALIDTYQAAWNAAYAAGRIKGDEAHLEGLQAIAAREQARQSPDREAESEDLSERLRWLACVMQDDEISSMERGNVKPSDWIKEAVDALALPRSEVGKGDGSARCQPCLTPKSAIGEGGASVEKGVYVASRASVPERGRMWRALRAAGRPIIATWIDEDGEGQTQDNGELWSRILREVTTAERLIFYAEPGDFPLKGAYVEVGMALAAGVPVFVVAPLVPLEFRTFRPIGSWMAHPLVRFADTVDAAFDLPITHSQDGTTEQSGRPREDQNPSHNEEDRLRAALDYACDVRWQELADGAEFTSIDRLMLRDLLTKARAARQALEPNTPATLGGEPMPMCLKCGRFRTTQQGCNACTASYEPR